MGSAGTSGGSSRRLLLRAVYPGGEEQEVYLAPRLSIGRSGDNVFVVPDAQVERHHAMVHLRNGEFWLEAYSEHARVEYQGEPVTQVPLRPGVQSRIGPVEFTRLSAEAAASSAHSVQRWQRCPGCGSPELPSPGEKPQPCPHCGHPLVVVSAPGEAYRVGLPADLAGLELRRVAGRGGMAWVIQAYDPQRDDLVALKLLFPHLAVQPEQSRRFARESQALAEVRNSRVIRLWGHGQWEGLPWLKLQWVPGCTLKGVIEGHDYAREPFPFDRALRWMVQVGEGLRAIHARGYVHRDVKPSNVLIDREGEALVSDLGVGRRIEGETTTLTGQLLGTWLYLAPECFHAPDRVDHRADQYSLGATFYHLLVGRAPQGRWALPGDRNETVPEWFDGVMERLLSPSPEDRYESMEELLEELGGHEEKTPSPAPGPEAMAVSALGPRIAPSSSPAPSRKSAEELQQKPILRRFNRITWVLAGGVAALVLLVMMVVFFLRTDKGMIRVEINDPQVEVQLKGANNTLRGVPGGQEIQVEPGSYALVVRRGDFQFETPQFILRRGQRVSVRVDYIQGQVVVRQGTRELARAQMPQDKREEASPPRNTSSSDPSKQSSVPSSSPLKNPLSWTKQ